MDKRLLASVIKMASLEQIEEFLEKMEVYAITILTDMLLKVPSNISKPERFEPEEDKPEYKFMKKITRLRFSHNKPFTWLPETGKHYGGKIKFVWPECDNAQLVVPNAETNYSPNGHNHATYFCGTQNKPEESNGIRASIFGPAGCRATFVELHYN